MPPTALARSSTTTEMPRSERRHAADRPAGPAPSTTTAGCFGSGPLGNDNLVEIHRKRQLVSIGAEEVAALRDRAAHARHRYFHLDGRHAGAVEHHAFAAADFEDVAAGNAVDAREHLATIHPVEVPDDAGDLGVVAF